MFGSALSTASYDARAQGMLADKSVMETNTTPHYLTVSLWAVSAATDA